MTRKSKASSSRHGVFGAHPLLVATAAIVFVMFGAVMGAWYNVSQKPQSNVAAGPQATTQAARVAPSNTAASVSRPQSYQPPPFLSLNSEKFSGPSRNDPRIDGFFSRSGETLQSFDPPAPPAEVSRPPMVAYAVPTQADPALPAIAIVVDDMGLDRARSQRMVELPAPLTLSFLTYAHDLQGWADLARRAGHEVMVHVPMEPLNGGEDPGPRALTMAMSPGEIAAGLHSMLTGWTGFVGINNHMGSRLTADPERMAAVMSVLKADGLFWLDSRTTAATRGEALAATALVPHVARDVFLDNDANATAIAAQLAEVERLAHEHGSAIAIGHPHDATHDALATWLQTVRERGFAIVPVTEIVRRKSASVTSKAAANANTAG
ncbi:MAG: divergent polysaccharide deacetylase family protein [Rhodobacteraceae bacterium]|nr:divergent polysaccharide deacetylase family protein [Paracoccaceae bacterium]